MKNDIPKGFWKTYLLMMSKGGIVVIIGISIFTYLVPLITQENNIRLYSIALIFILSLIALYFSVKKELAHFKKLINDINKR